MKRTRRKLLMSGGLIVASGAAMQHFARLHDENHCKEPGDTYCKAKDLIWNGEIYEDERREKLAEEEEERKPMTVIQEEPEPDSRDKTSVRD